MRQKVVETMINTLLIKQIRRFFNKKHFFAFLFKNI